MRKTTMVSYIFLALAEATAILNDTLFYKLRGTVANKFNAVFFFCIYCFSFVQ